MHAGHVSSFFLVPTLISDPKPGIQQPVCEQNLLADESAHKLRLCNLLISTCKTWNLSWCTTINNFLNTRAYRSAVSFPRVSLLKVFTLGEKSI